MRLKAFLATLFLLSGIGDARALEAPADSVLEPRLTLSAAGVIKASPDLAVITLAVTGEAPSAAEALSRSRSVLEATQKSIMTEGLSKADIHATGLSIIPQYVFHQDQKSTLSGYRATARISVEVHDLARVGDVLDAAVKGGADTVSGVAYGLANPAAAQDAARREAVKALRAEAELYAGALGLKVARVISLSDETQSSTRGVGPLVMSAALAAAPGAPLPDAAALNISANVAGVFALSK